MSQNKPKTTTSKSPRDQKESGLPEGIGSACPGAANMLFRTWVVEEGPPRLPQLPAHQSAYPPAPASITDRQRQLRGAIRDIASAPSIPQVVDEKPTKTASATNSRRPATPTPSSVARVHQGPAHRSPSWTPPSWRAPWASVVGERKKKIIPRHRSAVEEKLPLIIVS